MVNQRVPTFSTFETKESAYEDLLDASVALFHSDSPSSSNDNKLPAITNLSNASALLQNLFQHTNPSVEWVGFYVTKSLFTSPSSSNSNSDPNNNNKKEILILGPFQGGVACQEIPFGKGVCGVAAEKQETQVVPDVHKFPGYIACDAVSKSEIVVPLIDSFGNTVAVLDIDSVEYDSFDSVDKEYLEKYAKLIVENTRW